MVDQHSPSPPVGRDDRMSPEVSPLPVAHEEDRRIEASEPAPAGQPNGAAPAARATHSAKGDRAKPVPQGNASTDLTRIVVPRGGGVPLQPRKGWPTRRSYAAIDLGTNNCRLLIARPSSDGFIVVDAFSRVVRLGEGLAATGRISAEAMDRAVAALSVCADKLRRRNVALARSVATEACRRAVNGPEFIERVTRETGIRLDVITAEEEARLAVLGCHALLEPGEGPALIFDIGGGSTELVLVDAEGPVPRILDWESAPWGVVSLTEAERHDDSDGDRRAQAYAAMRERVRQSFARFAERLPQHTIAPRLLGTSGTVTTLASLHLGLPSYDRNAIDGLVVPAASMRDISDRLAHLAIPERAKLPCIGNERADLVVAGCAILESILDIWPAERLGVADRGIREGIVRTLITGDRPVRSVRR